MQNSCKICEMQVTTALINWCGDRQHYIKYIQVISQVASLSQWLLSN